MECFDLVKFIIIAVIIYKVLDWAIRLIYVGNSCERYILVTGCDTGFGNLLAKRLDSIGCHVFAGCLTDAGMSELGTQCSPRLIPIHMNVADSDSIVTAYKFIKEALPVDKGLWAVVNNAGIGTTLGPPEWSCVKDYKRINKVNLYGMIDVTMTFLPLVKMERGRIVNMSSSGGRMCSSFIIPYCVSKYGVEAFSDGMRRGLQPFGVKVSIIEPGWHSTRLTEPKTLIGNVVNTWTNSSPEGREEYGEEYYEFCRTELLETMKKLGSKRPENVVDAYIHAVLGRFPRSRYLVGNDINYVYTLLWMLPEWISDNILYKSYGNLPTPACLLRNK